MCCQAFEKLPALAPITSGKFSPDGRLFGYAFSYDWSKVRLNVVVVRFFLLPFPTWHIVLVNPLNPIMMIQLPPFIYIYIYLLQSTDHVHPIPPTSKSCPLHAP